MVGAALGWGIAYVSYSVIMGHMGSDAVAANSITTIAKNMLSCLIRGVSGGAGVLIGNLLGAGELDKAKEMCIRDSCKYVRHFAKPELEKGGRAYLEFNGAAMTADVVVNGTKLFHHEGGFSTFRVDVTEQLTEDNLLEVYVDNSDNTKVYPQKADFTFYGGLYRMVKLVTVPKVHFVMDLSLIHI